MQRARGHSGGLRLQRRTHCTSRLNRLCWSRQAKFPIVTSANGLSRQKRPLPKSPAGRREISDDARRWAAGSRTCQRRRLGMNSPENSTAQNRPDDQPSEHCFEKSHGAESSEGVVSGKRRFCGCRCASAGLETSPSCLAKSKTSTASASTTPSTKATRTRKTSSSLATA